MRLALSFCLATLIPFLSSCQTHPPRDVIWNPDGKSMTDLRTLRLRGDRPSATLTPGVTLYADRIDYLDKRRQHGEASGRVYVEVGPQARYAWLVENGYADRAAFNTRGNWLVLAGNAMLEREKMTQIATEPYTEIEIRWGTLVSDIILRGPTRTDFAKSNRLPPGVTIRGAAAESSLRSPVSPRKEPPRIPSKSKN
ncbi:MAG: hypothetical protein ACAI34_03515 [Verrucomicrobium sp.]